MLRRALLSSVSPLHGTVRIPSPSYSPIQALLAQWSRYASVVSSSAPPPPPPLHLRLEVHRGRAVEVPLPRRWTLQRSPSSPPSPRPGEKWDPSLLCLGRRPPVLVRGRLDKFLSVCEIGRQHGWARACIRRMVVKQLHPNMGYKV